MPFVNQNMKVGETVKGIYVGIIAVLFFCMVLFALLRLSFLEKEVPSFITVNIYFWVFCYAFAWTNCPTSIYLPDDCGITDSDVRK